MRADHRISAGAADPLPILQTARLYVQPAFGEGFAYAAAEAMACGLPVLVSDETGMKDLLAAGGAGTVLPTGDVNALAEAIDAAYRGEAPGVRATAASTTSSPP
jgi:glycosyltransferase involved in cell wall biosynthesis